MNLFHIVKDDKGLVEKETGDGASHTRTSHHVARVVDILYSPGDSDVGSGHERKQGTRESKAGGMEDVEEAQ